jgi:hypothetical protein
MLQLLALGVELCIYLLENEYIRGDAGVEALGWDEDKNMELKLKAEEHATTSPGQDVVLKMKLIALMEEFVLLLKIVVAGLVLVCVLVDVKK